MCDVFFFILLSKNPFFTVPNGYPYVMDTSDFNQTDGIQISHLKFHKSHSDSILLTVSGGLQYQKFSIIKSLSYILSYINQGFRCRIYFSESKL